MFAFGCPPGNDPGLDTVTSSVTASVVCAATAAALAHAHSATTPPTPDANRLSCNLCLKRCAPHSTRSDWLYPDCYPDCTSATAGIRRRTKHSTARDK